MTDPKSQVDMFEDERLSAILGNMAIVEGLQEEDKKPEPEAREIIKEE
jgi:hypothetical protein